MENNIQQISENLSLKSVENFEELNLNPDLLRGIYAFGFEKPTIIQQKGILAIISKRNTIAQAQSGTGKTTTFSIGILQLINPESPECQAVILAPTKEIALQINKIIFSLSQFLKITSRCCTVAADAKADRDALKNGGIHIIVGTPGRIKDMVDKKALKTEFVKVIVLDETEEISNRGFAEEVIFMFENLPTDVQVCLFSATRSQEILEITEKFMKDPIEIEVKNEQLTLDGIKQFFISIQKDEEKFPALLQLYKNLPFYQSLVFANGKEKVEEIAKKLTQEYCVASSIHGEMEMQDRVNIMKEFKSGSTKILVSTDVQDRGTDIQQVNLIINYDLHIDHAKYIHRIGRSDRLGRKIVAINFVTPRDADLLVKLRSYYKTQIDELPCDLSNLFD